MCTARYGLNLLVQVNVSFKDEFASLVEWLNQTALGQCFCCALVDVPIVMGVFIRSPTQELSAVPGGCHQPARRRV